MNIRTSEDQTALQNNFGDHLTEVGVALVKTEKKYCLKLVTILIDFDSKEKHRIASAVWGVLSQIVEPKPET